MKINFDNYGQMQTPQLTLCNANKEKAYSLGAAYNIKSTTRYNAISELEFDIAESADNSETINPAYNYIVNKMLVLLEDVGYYVILEADEGKDGTVPKKHVICKSLEVELLFRRITDFVGTYALYDTANPSVTLLGVISSMFPTWTIGEVDETLLASTAYPKYRTFDVNNNTMYNFLILDVEKAYNCVFEFNTFTRTISAHDIMTFSKTTDIYFSLYNLTKKIDFKEMSDELATALYCYGGDAVDIHYVNPLGTNAIYNFSYFKNLKWMSQGLIDSLNTWERAANTQQPAYSTLLNRLLEADTAMITAQDTMTEYQGNLQSLEDQKAAALAAQTPINAILQQIYDQQTLIATQGNVIANLQIGINDTKAQLKKIVHSITFTSSYSFSLFAEDLIAMLVDMNWISANWQITYNADTVNDYPTFDVDQFALQLPILINSINDSINYLTDVQTIVKNGFSSYPLPADELTSLQGAITTASNQLQTLFDLLYGFVPDTTVTTEISTIISQLTNYLDIVTYSDFSFTSDQYLELSNYIYENTYNNANIVVSAQPDADELQAASQDLYNQGSDVLSRVSQPRYEFTADISNFVALKEYIPFISQVELGRTASVQVFEGQAPLAAVMLEMVINYENPADFSMTFSNRYRLDNSKFVYSDLFGDAATLSGMTGNSGTASNSTGAISKRGVNGHVIEKDAVTFTQQPALNFTGDGVRVTNNPNNKSTDVDIENNGVIVRGAAPLVTPQRGAHIEAWKNFDIFNDCDSNRGGGNYDLDLGCFQLDVDFTITKGKNNNRMLLVLLGCGLTGAVGLDTLNPPVTFNGVAMNELAGDIEVDMTWAASTLLGSFYLMDKDLPPTPGTYRLHIGFDAPYGGHALAMHAQELYNVDQFYPFYHHTWLGWKAIDNGPWTANVPTLTHNLVIDVAYFGDNTPTYGIIFGSNIWVRPINVATTNGQTILMEMERTYVTGGGGTNPIYERTLAMSYITATHTGLTPMGWAYSPDGYPHNAYIQAHLLISINAPSTEERVGRLIFPLGSVTFDEQGDATMDIYSKWELDASFVTTDTYTSVDGNIAVFEGTDGKVIRDGGSSVSLLGATGVTGLQGITGFPGVSDIIGDTGVTGLLGQTGVTGIGNTGVTGIAGSYAGMGDTGVTGLVGSTGVTGITGTQGMTGITGAGVTGVTGAQGDPGGATGVTGAHSTVPGATGPQGGQGIKGSTGTTGADSTVPGATGMTGAHGATGVTGIPGSYAGMGDTGVTGIQGVTGNLGMTGVTGNTGATGITGVSNVPGATGTTGYGATGVTGIGNTGVTGISNVPGATGTTGYGGTGVTGIGNTGVTGVSDVPGDTGVTGITGATGTTGASITGSTGITGVSNVPGDTGVTGYGGTGVTGALGATGITGISNVPGATGATGLLGQTGVTGASVTGSTGITGISDIPGDTGVTGIGNTGVTGLLGQTGVTGVSNVPGATGTTGSSIIGSTGVTGLGTTGATGVTGLEGVTGAGGYTANGADWTFSTSTAESDPGTGLVSVNHINLNMATHVYINVVDTDGVNMAAWLQQMTYGGTSNNKGILELQFKSTGSYWYYTVTGTWTYTGGAYMFPITILALYNNLSSTITGDLIVSFVENGSLGPTGVTGISDIPGATGVTGKGNTGVTGITGATGVTGIGNTGVTGITGITGLQGIQGNSGVTGMQGIQGDSGVTGAQGDPGGATGITGLAGDPGDTGITGAQGDPGGATGVTGSAGDPGNNGDPGDTGVTGLQGDPGINGDSGDTGVTGIHGATGVTGIVGSSGVTGAGGPPGGATGVTGLKGVTGITGDPGGATGVTGLQGVTGIAAYLKMVWSGNAPPASPTAYDDEFDDGALDGKWSVFDPDSILTVTESSTYKSLLLDINTRPADTNIVGIYQTIPTAGEFTIWIKTDLISHRYNYTSTGLVLWEDPSDITKKLSTNHLLWGWDNIFWQTTSFTDYVTVSSEYNIASEHNFYYRIRRNSGGDYFYGASLDGISWGDFNGTRTVEFTPTAFGIFVNGGGGGYYPVRGLFQFFRYLDYDIGETGVLPGNLVDL